MGAINEVTDGNFQAEVIESEQPVLVDFLGSLVRSVPRGGSRP